MQSCRSNRVTLLCCPASAAYHPASSTNCSVPVTDHRVVLSHSDYCNSTLYGLPTSLTRRLQSVQNAAARLILLGIRRSEHTTPALISLHWLRVPECIFFELAASHSRYWTEISPVLLHTFFYIRMYTVAVCSTVQ